MTSFATTGWYGWIIVLLTLDLVVAAAICAARRVRSVVATTLLLAAFLPLGVGFLGVLSGRLYVFEVTETLAAPTQRDLSFGYARSDACLALGAAATVLCSAVSLVAVARAAKSPAAARP